MVDQTSSYIWSEIESVLGVKLNENPHLANLAVEARAKKFRVLMATLGKLDWPVGESETNSAWWSTDNPHTTKIGIHVFLRDDLTFHIGLDVEPFTNVVVKTINEAVRELTTLRAGRAVISIVPKTNPDPSDSGVVMKGALFGEHIQITGYTWTDHADRGVRYEIKVDGRSVAMNLDAASTLGFVSMKLATGLNQMQVADDEQG